MKQSENKKNKLMALYQHMQNCQCACPGEREGAGLVWDSDGNPDAGVVLIGEAPGQNEIKMRRPFVGQAGTKLEHYLKLAGLTRANLFITNTVKCRTTKNHGRANRTPRSCEIKTCAGWLDRELQIIAPGVILTLGDVALKRIKGDLSIGHCHGEPLPMAGCLLFPLYHPAAAIYRPALGEVIEQDFIRLGQWLREGPMVKC